MVKKEVGHLGDFHRRILSAGSVVEGLHSHPSKLVGKMMDAQRQFAKQLQRPAACWMQP